MIYSPEEFPEVNSLDISLFFYAINKEDFGTVEAYLSPSKTPGEYLHQDFIDKMGLWAKKAVELAEKTANFKILQRFTAKRGQRWEFLPLVKLIIENQRRYMGQEKTTHLSEEEVVVEYLKRFPSPPPPSSFFSSMFNIASGYGGAAASSLFSGALSVSQVLTFSSYFSSSASPVSSSSSCLNDSKKRGDKKLKVD